MCCKYINNTSSRRWNGKWHNVSKTEDISQVGLNRWLTWMPPVQRIIKPGLKRIDSQTYCYGLQILLHILVLSCLIRNRIPKQYQIQSDAYCHEQISPRNCRNTDLLFSLFWLDLSVTSLSPMSSSLFDLDSDWVWPQFGTLYKDKLHLISS